MGWEASFCFGIEGHLSTKPTIIDVPSSPATVACGDGNTRWICQRFLESGHDKKCFRVSKLLEGNELLPRWL
jgi:hypothetical protein